MTHKNSEQPFVLYEELTKTKCDRRATCLVGLLLLKIIYLILSLNVASEGKDNLGHRINH